MIKVAATSAMLLLAASTVACSSAESKERSVPTDPVSLANRALSVLSYSPAGKGWAYKSTAVGPEADSWVSEHKSQIEDALNQVGDDYVLQVTGHTCTIGPRTAPGDGRKGNVWYSTQRAQAVYNALARAGIPRDKMSVKGVASDELVPGIPSDDQKQRRVTFQIVPK